MSTRRISHTIQCPDFPAFVRRFVDLYACMVGLPPKSWLTNREKDLFVALVLAINEGRDLSDKEEMSRIVQITNFSKKSKTIYRYMDQLISKQWIAKTPDSQIIIPSLFHFESNALELDLHLQHAEV